METMNSKVKIIKNSFKKSKIKNSKNPILISKTPKYPAVPMFKFKTIIAKQFHFIRDQIRLTQIKWPQVLKSNLWLGLNI